MDDFRTIAGPGWIAWVDPEWEAVLRPEIERRFDPPNGSDITHPVGRRPHLAYLPAGAPRRVFVRFYHRGGAMRWLGDRYFGHGRVTAEIDVTRHAISKGIPAPRPLAGAAWRKGIGWRLAYVSEDCTGTVTFSEFYRSSDAPRRRAATARLCELIGQLTLACVSHADFHFDNVLVNPSDPVDQRVIDFDRAVRRQSPLGIGVGYIRRLARYAKRHRVDLDPEDRQVLLPGSVVNFEVRAD